MMLTHIPALASAFLGGRPFVPFDLSADPSNHISRDPSRLWHHGSRVFLRDLTANDALTRPHK
jgi:hypothetical protein